jgi:DNA-binding Lrp family transcriptional regulator
MDETDLRLCQLLLVNSRTPFRELADNLNISVQAVHRRVQNLFDIGAIERYYVMPSHKVWDRVTCSVYGHTTAESLDDIKKELSMNDNVHMIFTCSGNLLYVTGLLKSIAEIDDYIEYVKEVAKISEPQIGIIPPMIPYTNRAKKFGEAERPVKSLELRIIGSLHNNARKSYAEIAQELNISPRTVNRYLDFMIKEEMVYLTIVWLPTTTGDIFSIFHIKLTDDIQKNDARGRLLTKYSPRIVFFMPFSNIPDMCVAITWSRTMKELEDLQISVEGEEFVAKTQVNMVYSGERYDTWLERRLFDAMENAHGKR